jgi:hypothetical protein
MLSLRLLEIIDSSIIGAFVSEKQQIIERTNPDKIYVENVRAFFNTSYTIANFLCEKAVKFGYFEKYIGVQCPRHGNIIYTANHEIDVEIDVKCFTCEDLGFEDFEFLIKDLRPIIFYRLIKKKK